VSAILIIAWLGVVFCLFAIENFLQVLLERLERHLDSLVEFFVAETRTLNLAFEGIYELLIMKNLFLFYGGGQSGVSLMLHDLFFFVFDGRLNDLGFVFVVILDSVAMIRESLGPQPWTGRLFGLNVGSARHSLLLRSLRRYFLV
jgi:hypothetical protein